MSDFSVRLLKNPTAAQVDETVSLCLRAYEGDEGLNSLVGGDKSLVGLLFRAMICATAVGGEFYVVVNDSEKILGLGLWFGPGEDLFSTEEQRNLGFNDFFARLSPEAQRWWTEIYPPRVGEFLTRHLGPQGQLNSFFLNNLATDPPFQRMGIATKIVDTVFQQAIVEDNRLALIAVNTKNILIYESMGFRNEGFFELEAPTGSVTCTLLTRNARDK